MHPGYSADETEVVHAFLEAPCDDSYRTLFRVISPQVLSYFRVRGCERGLAEDLTQEVMLAVYVKRGHLRSRELFRPWLFRIARNCLLQHVRQSGRRVPTADFEAVAESELGTRSDSLGRSCISEWLAWLEPRDRELVILRYVEGLEHHEMAAMLQMPIGTVQWRVFQLKRKLAERFSGQRT